MDELIHLAELIKKRNLLECEITTLIRRPAEIGHLGEYIASRIFSIVLEESASQKGIDGRFIEGMLTGKTVNIKWYAKREGLLDITPNSLPDYYLVLAGPKSSMVSSRGKTRPWLIENVFIFDALDLVGELKRYGVKIGIATSVRQYLWERAEIHPIQKCEVLQLSEAQRRILALFGSN